MDNAAIDDFIAAFNRLHKLLQRELGAEDMQYIEAVRLYEKRFGKRHYDDFRLIGNLRNHLVHDRVHPEVYLATPTEAASKRLYQLIEWIEKPVRVYPKYSRNVLLVRENHTLSQVLEYIDTNNYSQFPVYGGHEEIRGLLTENGIVRYLALHQLSKDTLIELNDVTVAELLNNDENASNFTFVSRQTLQDAAIARFAASSTLEAIFITETGRRTEQLLGIITRWDVIETS